MSRPIPAIEPDDLHRALLDAFKASERDDLADVRRAATVLDAATVNAQLLCAARDRLAATGHKYRTSKLGADKPSVPADDGAPDVRHAPAWLVQASRDLKAFANQHSDSRLGDIAVTLDDIAARCDITPKSEHGSRAWAIDELGCAVLYRADSLAWDDGGDREIPNGDPLLVSLVEAFPHGSLSEMLETMLSAIRADDEHEPEDDDEREREALPVAEFTLTIKLGNAEMQSHEDVAEALRRTARLVGAEGLSAGIVRDSNGNTVGRFNGGTEFGWTGDPS